MSIEEMKKQFMDTPTQEELNEVIDKELEECSFAKYGFEKPDFECEILKEYGDYLIGARLDLDVWIHMRWYKKTGGAYLSDDFNLTPIKKPWYEDESNFPCLCYWNGGEEFIHIVNYDKKENSISGIGENSYYPSEIRLATKEEVLSLYKEEK